MHPAWWVVRDNVRTGRSRSGWSALCGILLALSLTIPQSHASPGPEKKKEAVRPPRSRTRQIRRHLSRLIRDGDSNLYISGHAHHSRSSYRPWLLEQLNENAWGGGYGRSLQFPNGNVASLAATAFVDSLGNWEYNLGYMREWRTAPFDGRFKLGIGLSALLISRPDFFEGTPFPAALPQLSAAYGGTTLIAVLIPRFSNHTRPADELPGMNGDVIYTFARIKLP